MEVFKEFLSRIDHPEHRARTEEVLAWVFRTYPRLEAKIAWNQPMFTDHGTFIIAFSVARQHLAVAPERAGIAHFSAMIAQAGYEHSRELVRMPWKKAVDFGLLEQMIEFNIAEKADCATFWRK